jgi:molybdenum cofactor cytidylyltransferase
MVSVRIVAIVLAAGEGTRMGGPKALLRTSSATFLARTCATLARPRVERVVAVVGADAARVTAFAGIPAGVVVRANVRWREGMLGSIWTGLEYADAASADAVLVHPVDNPFVADTTVDDVVAALEAGARIAVPSHAGRRGHPAGFARAAWPALRGVEADRGARGVLADHPEWIVHVAAGPDCLVDVDTPADLRASLNGFPEEEEPPRRP